MILRPALILLATGTLVLAIPAQADAPVAGARYDGRSATGERIFLSVRPDGSRLDDYAFFAKMDCSDGRRRRLGLLSRGEGPTPILADGSFAYTSPNERYRFRGAPAGQAQTRFEGRFETAGDAVSGTITTTFRSARFNCSNSQVPFTIHRDGTAGAPYRNASVASGRYRARGRRTTVTFKSLLPAGVVDPIRLKSKFRCQNGVFVGNTTTLRGLRLRGQAFSQSGRFRTRLGGGVVANDHYRLSARLHYDKGYRVSGRWQDRAVFTRRGRDRITCRVDVRFRGSLVSGPIGVEGPHPGH